MQWTTEGSARTYRLLKLNDSLNPFEYNDTVLTQRVLFEATNNTQLNDTGAIDLSFKTSYGRFPGSWTLPVCDISGYGGHWNFDFVNKTQNQETAMGPFRVPKGPLPHPPCMCGKAVSSFLKFSGRVCGERMALLTKWQV